MLNTPESVAFYRLIVTEGHRNDGQLGKLFYQKALERSTAIFLRMFGEYLPGFPDQELSALHLFAMLKEPWHQKMLILGEPPAMTGDAEIRAFIKKVLDRFLYGILPA